MDEYFQAHTASTLFAFGFVAIFLIRTAFWKFAPRYRACETCEHAGDAKRVVRGSYVIEIPVLAVGLTVGLFVHLLLVFAIFVFLWRTFGAYLVCAKCESERLLKADRPPAEQKTVIVPPNREESKR